MSKDKNFGYDSMFDFPDPPTEEVVEPRSFRNKLIRVLCYTALVPILMLGLFQQQQFEKAMRTADVAQLSMVQNVAENVRLNVAGTQRILDLLIQTIGQDPIERMHKELQRVLDTVGNLQAVVFFDSNHRILASAVQASTDAAYSKLDKVVELLHQASKNSQGEAFVQSVSGPQALLAIGQPPDSMTTGRSLSAAALLKTNFLRDTVRRHFSSGEFDAVVLDERGQILYAHTSDSTQANRALQGLDEQKEAIRSSADGIIVRTPGTRDVSQVKAYVYMEDLGWTIAVSQPQRVRDQIQRDSLETSGFFLLVAVVLTLLIGSYMNVSLTKSVNTLMDSVETFGRTGRFKSVSKQLEKDGTTEIIELGKTFERMAGEVQESQARLEKMNAQLETEVADRTSTLMSRNSELRALQRLLMPMQGVDPASSIKKHIGESIAQFQMLLGMNELRFIPAESEQDEVIEPFVIPVELSGRVYGWLTPGSTGVLTSDRTDSLRRLANSLAIVLANDTLLSQLAKEHATLATVFESMTDGVVILGRSGKVIYANDLACQLLNDDRPLIGIVGGKHLQERYGIDLENVDGGTVQHSRERLVRRTPQGEVQTLDLTHFTVSDLPEFPGKRHGWLVRDISREAGIDAMKENLVSVVAHELKTPVTALRLLTETLHHDAAAGRVSEKGDVQELLDETLRLGQLIDDLLDVSRIEGGAMKLNKRVVQVASLIDRAARLAKTRYPIEIERRIDADAEVICADPERMTQVFINLFINSARYRKPEQTTAKCTVMVEPADNRYIRISITDHGRGIEPCQLVKIFEPFYQTDMTTRRTGGGAGLGLTIVKGIVAAHNGEVTVTSVQNVYTTFVVTLPT